jgi:peptide/nickel transport system permease protein
LSWIAGNLLGLYAACKRGIFDRVFYPVSLFLSSVPFFCFGLILLFIFFTLLPVVDSVGAYSSDILHPEWSRSFVLDVLKHYWLPFSSIFFIMLGGQAVGMRSLALYELDTDYIVYSEALGVKESTRLRYVFRNALLPQLTGLALSLGTMIGGTLITELIFSYPGLGMMMLDAIQSQDYPLIQATAAIIAIAVLSLNFGVDLLVGCIDPRIRAAHANGGTA